MTNPENEVSEERFGVLSLNLTFPYTVYKGGLDQREALNETAGELFNTIRRKLEHYDVYINDYYDL